uniref:Uncharacterized protein n=1 Tax=Opuntia streptacantha TaxID=393608 RepID=A0A7C9CMG0_OPUST
MRNPDVLFLFSQKMFRLQSDRCYLLMITVCSCFTYFLFWSLASAYILFVSSKVLPIISSASLTWKHLSKILTAGNLVFMYMETFCTDSLPFSGLLPLQGLEGRSM